MVNVLAGAWDCHAHIFEDRNAFPLAADAGYDPPLATAQAYLKMLDQIGMRYGVLVQGAPYGLDNGALLAALKAHPDRLKGVALASATATAREIAEMRAAGIMGLRFSHFPAGSANIATVGLEALRALAPILRDHGMHAQIWMPLPDFVAGAKELLKLRIPLVLDHMARCDPREGMDGGAFRELRCLFRDEDIWIKAIPHRVSERFPGYEDMRPIHEALADTRAERLLWGTDWPFVRMAELTPLADDLLKLFLGWTPDEALRRAVLVDNPTRLYGLSG